MLTFLSGEPFASGKITYSYGPAHKWEQTSRILVPVEIEGVPVIAVVDTGAPYVVCPPQVAAQAGLQPEEDDPTVALGWHGDHTGYLFRRPIRLRAEAGEDAIVEATIFVPDASSAPAWEAGRRPFILGMVGCLERMRFAVDPGSDTFYFAAL